MAPISSTFNHLANYQALLLLLFFWISFSIDSDKRKAKEQRKRVSRNIEQQYKIVVPAAPVCGFR